jgi:hypothetical protein
MKRTLKRITAIAVIAAAAIFGGNTALTAWITWHKNYQAHSMHEGHVIVDEIHAHDPSINATWTTDGDQPNVVIRNVFDREKQDTILAWAKAVKQQGRVHRRISLDFQKETPHSSLSDTFLRTEHF